ncbi:MAG TPA: aminopeptidase P family protein [Thermomicrobiales bacterium]|nr:aminopeptidase P family protein [Thermomicrobiales bacterium]
MSRVDRARDLLREAELDAALVTHPANRFWLTGFPAEDHGPDESSGVVVIDHSGVTLLVSGTNFPWAAAAARPGVAVERWTHPWPAFVADRLLDSGARRVGFEEQALTVGDWSAMRAQAGDQIELLPLQGGLDRLREVKEDEELALLERAIAITDDVFLAIRAELRPGMTERAVADRIEALMREHGAQGPSFPTIVAAGPHTARPHHEPSERPLAASEPIIIDMGARLDGYCADLTRTVCLGPPAAPFATIYDIVLTAQAAALSAIRAGMTGREADATAREAIAAAGHGDRFIHGLGHGLGVKVHEAPSLGRASDDVLRPGQVVTVEPGIYLEDWGGVRIEDVGVVTDDGLRDLTHAPKAADAMLIEIRT